MAVVPYRKKRKVEWTVKLIDTVKTEVKEELDAVEEEKNIKDRMGYALRKIKELEAKVEELKRENRKLKGKIVDKGKKAKTEKSGLGEYGASFQ